MLLLRHAAQPCSTVAPGAWCPRRRASLCACGSWCWRGRRGGGTARASLETKASGPVGARERRTSAGWIAPLRVTHGLPSKTMQRAGHSQAMQMSRCSARRRLFSAMVTLCATGDAPRSAALRPAGVPSGSRAAQFRLILASRSAAAGCVEEAGMGEHRSQPATHPAPRRRVSWTAAAVAGHSVTAVPTPGVGSATCLRSYAQPSSACILPPAWCRALPAGWSAATRNY